MEKKISKQREKIEKLLRKKTELDLKVSDLEDEISEERKMLQNLEKDYVASYMSEHTLTAEEVIRILSDRQEVEQEEETEELNFNTGDEIEFTETDTDNESKSFWR